VTTAIADVRTGGARRNQPCPCGSGRKYKVCCERQDEPPIAEISIERAFLGFGADMSDWIANSDPGEKVIHVSEVLYEMDVAWATGRRTLLVKVDSGGGQLEAGILLHDALRVWRLAGGHVVVFVSNLAASTMSWAILAADMIDAAPGSQIVVHGTGAAFLSPQRARELRFVDYIGDYDCARSLANNLAHGVDVPSARRKALAARGKLSKFSRELAGLHEAAMQLRSTLRVEWDTRTPIGAAVAAELQRSRTRLAAALSQAQPPEARQ
jgi:ClpP class serine protease